MNKTIKRALLLVTVVAVMMTAAVFAMAADCEHYSTDVIVYPTCTEKGHTISVCFYCGEEVTISDYTDPVGHGLLDREYTAEGDYYELTRDCGKIHKSLVRDADGEIVFDAEGNAVYEDAACDYVYTSAFKYYKVDFVNPCVTAETDPEITYTLVTKTLKSEAVTVSGKAEAEFDENRMDPIREYFNNGSEIVLFVREGNAADFDGNEPRRDKDYNYGKYNFAGWSTVYSVNSTNTDPSGIVDIAETPINANTTYYARFFGKAEAYTVNFVNYNSIPLSSNIAVVHGHGITYDAAEPTKEADVANIYTFAGWTSNNKLVNLDKIYANLTLTAKFEATPCEYTVSYLDYQKNELTFKDDITFELMLEETVQYGAKAQAQNDMTDDVLAKAPDRENIYVHSGEWTFLENSGFRTTLSSVKVPDYYYDAEGNYVKTKNGDKFTLIPLYNSKKVVYTYKFQIVNTFFDDDNKNHTLENFSIQVKDAAGQLVATGKTDANGVLERTLYYSQGYTITAVSADNKYLAEQFIAAPIYEDSLDKIDYTIRPSRNPDYDTDHYSSCGCICHNALFKGIIVKIYNIIYRLFNVKYTCCYDMYANIGSLLVYTAD